ncbi:CRISPR-associated endonuclease Cas2 [Psychrobacter alimentarius]|uniref:CRISPR-associated endonuclease Cas2 n=1 Tax=Psychrobacter alimentarius TaxID=261164 RepID=UPI003FCFD2AC
MTQRLYLVGYDISEPKRQALLRYNIKNYSATGQQSAYECILSKDSMRQLSELAVTKIEKDDAFFIIKTVKTYWSQVPKDDLSKPKDTTIDHFYIG